MNKLLYILLTISLLAACTTKRIDEPEPSTDSTDPMLFRSMSEVQQDAQGAPARNAELTRSALLQQGFMVSCWKAFGYGNEHVVMDRYNVEYKTSGTAWDGTVRPYWDYTTVPGQYERFWDYSNFPYRFHAVTPYPTNTGDITFDNRSLTISAPYRMQTSLNGLVTPTDAEPYMLAQLQRGLDGVDNDLLATSPEKRIVNSTSTSKNRYVALPFHHLNSKVRFGVYTTSLWATDNPLYIEDLSIKVVSPGFVKDATGYQAAMASAADSWYIGSGNSGFTGCSYDNTCSLELLHFDGGKDVADNDMSLHQGRSSAYWLQCPDGIMQIPQVGVSMQLSLTLYKMDGTPYKTFSDVPIKLQDSDDTRFDWKSGYQYTYYLIISGIDEKLEFTFTATLTPWEDVSGSLSTDLEQ